MKVKIAVTTMGDSRDDLHAKRRGVIAAHVAQLDWLRDRFDVLESHVIRSGQDAAAFAAQVHAYGAQALIVHLPIWADPVLTIKLQNHLCLPILLLGNTDPSTGSLVGLLAAGGALDQIGCRHTRGLDHATAEERLPVLAFLAAAGARAALKGQTLGLFGGRSLGIITATADPSQWQRLFGVDIQHLEQGEIVALAESLPHGDVERHYEWLTSRVGSVTFGGGFSADRLERQVRSYLATRRLVSLYGLDFVGVKCQPEMTDGYVSQCVAHMLMNGKVDAEGDKPAFVHACESDADGAVSMQILHLLSGGQPTALLDIRWLNPRTGVWTLVNCGAMPAAFFATPDDPTGLGAIQIVPHIFGVGGGGALPAVATPRQVTLARLCRKDGAYWMAIVSGSIRKAVRADLGQATPAYPQAFVCAPAGRDFIMQFGSNHLHMVEGDCAEALVAFCGLSGIPYQRWG